MSVHINGVLFDTILRDTPKQPFDFSEWQFSAETLVLTKSQLTDSQVVLVALLSIRGCAFMHTQRQTYQ